MVSTHIVFHPSLLLEILTPGRLLKAVAEKMMHLVGPDSNN
jgi:hypothetical protein